MAVVAVFQKAPPGQTAAPIAVPGRAQLLLWMLLVGDVMVAAWMLAVGADLDRSAPFGVVMTLGGRHVLVLSLALGGFTLLGGLAMLTGGIALARRGHVPALVLAALVSIAGLGGVLSVLLFVVLAVVLAAFLGAAFLGRGTVFVGYLGGLFRR